MATVKKVIAPPKKKPLEQPIAQQFEGNELKEISPDAEKFIKGEVVKSSPKKKLVNFNIDEELLAKFDDKARSLGLNRSSFITFLITRAVSDEFEVKL